MLKHYTAYGGHISWLVEGRHNCWLATIVIEKKRVAWYNGSVNNSKQSGRIIIPGGRQPWPHELRIANILAMAGHNIEFLPEANVSMADILLDGLEYEIKSPFTNKPDKLERNLKRALKQSKNIILDSSRVKNMRDDNLRHFLIRKAREQKQIGHLILITKHGQIIDITALV